MMRGLPTRLLALIVCLVAASPAQALVDDTFTSKTQPANTLVMPFDATTGRTSFLLVSNLAGTSDGGIAAVTTHWSFWSDTCTHLLDVPICLTLNDTIVVDPTNVSPTNAANEAVGPSADLSGNRGFVTVTAFATDSNCTDASLLGHQLVDNALVGTMTLADSAIGKAFAIDAIGLGLGETGDFVELPDLLLSPNGNDGFLSLQTFNPETIEESIVILIALKENAGSLPGEVGPIGSAVSANVGFFDNIETRTSLPDTSIPCTLFTSAVPSDTGSLVPGTVTLSSSGFVQLTNITVGSTPVGDADGNDGNDTWVYGFHGQSIAMYAAASTGKYEVLGDIVVPTPTPAPSGAPSGTPTPTVAPTPTAVVSPTPGVTVTPGTSPTAGPTATPGATATPGQTPTATAAATPTPTPAGVACTQVDVTIAVNFNQVDVPDMGGITVALGYAAGITMPGVGSQPSVLQRVTQLSSVSGGLFSAGDADGGTEGTAGTLSIGLISPVTPIAPGNFARARFDCAPSGTVPPLSAFTCSVDASANSGNPAETQCVLTVAPVTTP